MSKTVKDIQNHLEQIRKAGIEAEEARVSVSTHTIHVCAIMLCRFHAVHCEPAL